MNIINIFIAILIGISAASLHNNPSTGGILTFFWIMLFMGACYIAKNNAKAFIKMSKAYNNQLNINLRYVSLDKQIVLLRETLAMLSSARADGNMVLYSERFITNGVKDHRYNLCKKPLHDLVEVYYCKPDTQKPDVVVAQTGNIDGAETSYIMLGYLPPEIEVDIKYFIMQKKAENQAA